MGLVLIRSTIIFFSGILQPAQQMNQSSASRMLRHTSENLYLEQVKLMFCEKCEHKNRNIDEKCRNCGTDLKRLSEDEVSAMLIRLSERSDNLIASKFDKIMKWVFFILVPVSFILCFISTNEIWLLDAFLSAFFLIFAGITAGFPSAVWQLEKLRISFFADSDDITPNEYWPFARRALYLFMGACGIYAAAITFY